MLMTDAQMVDLLDSYFYDKPSIPALWPDFNIKGTKTCSDCKDGYYYPLVGEREPCDTCSR